MNTKRYIFIIISFFSILTNCQAQEKDDDPLLEKINTTISQIEGIVGISEMSFGISLNGGDDRPFDSENKNNFKTPNNQKSDAFINTFIDSLYITQTLIPPYNFIELDFGEDDLIRLEGLDSFYFHNNPDESPFFELETITFQDGTTINAKNHFLSADVVKKKYYTGEKLNEPETILEDIYTPFKKHFLIKDKRPIKNIQFKFTRFKKNRKTYTLNNNGEKTETKYGTIYLDGIANNTLSFRIPSVINKNIQVNALYKDGRFLKSTGGGSFTYLSDEKKRFYENYLEILKKAKLKISKSKIKTEKELEKYLKKQAPKFVEDVPYTLRNYSFNGPINSVELIVSDTTSVSTIHNPIYNFDNQEYFIATDFKTEKKGIVDHSGKWIAAPNFTRNFRKSNDYFYRDQLSYGGYNNPRDYDNYYLFNPQNETLTKVDYKLDEIEIYADKFVQIEPRTNGPIGVLDVTTNQIIIPMEHRWLKYYAPGIWIGDNVYSENAGAYDAFGKTILPFNFDVIKFKDGFFYTVSGYKEKNKRDIEDVYNIKGKNITKGKYDDIEGTFNDGLQLVAKYTFKEGTINIITASDYFFIDKNGKEILSFPDETYHKAEPFVNGLAKVEKTNNDNLKYDGDFGFVNTKGKVIIPFMYKEATIFFGKYAFVKYKKGTDIWKGFIDKNNKRILELSSDISDKWYDKKAKKHYIKTDEGIVYDFDGNKVE